MKVSNIYANNLNRRKVGDMKQQQCYTCVTQNAANVGLPSNIYMHPVQFGKLIQQRPLLNALSEFYGIISPYDGLPMLPSKVFTNLQNTVGQYSPINYTDYAMKVISEPKNRACLKKVNAAVFSKIKEHRITHPNDNLFDSLLALRPNAMKNVIIREARVLNNIEGFSQNLSHQAKNEIKFLLNETRNIINGSEEDFFRRKIFIQKINEIISKYPNENSETLAQIKADAVFLPSSTTNADAFIVKYSRPLKAETQMSTSDISSRINDLSYELKSILTKKHYSEFHQYIVDLRMSLVDNSGYKKARNILACHVNKLTKRINCIADRKALNTKMRNVPLSPFSSPNEDLSLRQLAIITRLAGDSAMSAEHLIAQDEYANLILEHPEWKNKLTKEQNSQHNLILVDRQSNSKRSNQNYEDFVKENPLVLSTYMPAHFKSIFKIISENQLSDTYVPFLENQIKYILQLSKGENQIGHSFLSAQKVA